MNGQIMKDIVAAFAGMFLIACAGCGGGGGGGSSPDTTKTAHTPKPISVDDEGDSTMYGSQLINGVIVRSANNAPVISQQNLRTALGDTVSVENYGSPGATIMDALNGNAPRYTRPLATRLASDSSQIILSNFGINDSLNISQSDYRSGLMTLITTVRGMGKTPVFEEPNPVCGNLRPNLDAYVAILRDVASQQGVLLIQQYDYIKSLPNWQAMLSDCVHPLDSLYLIKGQREAEQLAPLVKSMM